MKQIYNPDKLSKSQLWMLALGAILAEGNDEGHDTLNGGYNNIQTTLSSLNRDFGIKNRTDLISCLNSLIKGSSIAAEFLEQSNFLSVLSEDVQKTYIEQIPSETRKHIDYTLVKTYNHSISSKNLLSWDCGRYVNLCRKGTVVNYISEKEAWDFMKRFALKAQKTYSSWREYGLAYAVGRQYWQGLLTKDYADEQLTLIKSLLVNENSPWVMLDWNTPLD